MMLKWAFALVFALMFVTSASAQTRAKLDAPGKVPFGTSYEQAQVLLGPDAKPTAGKLDNMKALSCRGCLPLKGAGLIVMFFLDGGGLISIEAKYSRGEQPSLEACEKQETDILPALIAQYGEPDLKEFEQQSYLSKRWVSFKFADGSLIEYTVGFVGGLPGMRRLA